MYHLVKLKNGSNGGLTSFFPLKIKDKKNRTNAKEIRRSRGNVDVPFGAEIIVYLFVHLQYLCTLS